MAAGISASRAVRQAGGVVALDGAVSAEGQTGEPTLVDGEVVEANDGPVRVGDVQDRSVHALFDSPMLDAEPVATLHQLIERLPTGNAYGERIEAAELGAAGDRPAVAQGDREATPTMKKAGTTQDSVFPELVGQLQVKQGAIPAHATGKVADRHLHVLDVREVDRHDPRNTPNPTRRQASSSERLAIGDAAAVCRTRSAPSSG